MYDADIGKLNILFDALSWIFSILFISSLSIFPHARIAMLALGKSHIV